MASRIQSRLLRPLLRRSGPAGAGSVREVTTFHPLRSPENDATTTPGETEDFASKILLEMRGRKGEEVRSFACLGFAFSCQFSHFCCC
jgi:hypothetical protein